MDAGIGGRPGKSDPYLKVKLGKEVRSLVSCPRAFDSIDRSPLFFVRLLFLFQE